MSERRQEMRVPCRLHCRVVNGSDNIQALIIDVSKGGICLVSPVWLKPRQRYEISIAFPGANQSKVQAEIWHIRREKSNSSSSRVWIAGAMLVDADTAYAKLLKAADAGSDDNASTRPGEPSTRKRGTPSSPDESELLESIDSKIYRIRCKLIEGPRTRVLSLAADSEEQARALAIRDLGSEWTVLEIRGV